MEPDGALCRRLSFRGIREDRPSRRWCALISPMQQSGGTVTAPWGTIATHSWPCGPEERVGAVASYEFAFVVPATLRRSSVLRHGWERSFYEFAAILLAEGVISGKEIPSGSGSCGSSQGRITSPGLSSPR